MPGFDRTGPQGRGPETGRGLGPCGRGLGRGGFRRSAAPAQAYTKEQDIVRSTRDAAQLSQQRLQEAADLKAEKELLERDLKAVAERVKELEKGK